MSVWLSWSKNGMREVTEIFNDVEVPTYNADEVAALIAKLPEEYRGLDLNVPKNGSVSVGSLKEFCRYLPLLQHAGGYSVGITENEVALILFTQDHKMVFTFSRDGHGLEYTMLTKYGGHSLYRKRLHGELVIVDDADLILIERVLKLLV